MRPNLPFAPGDPVVAYLRDSGHEDQELSVAQQEAAIRAWCADVSLALTRVYSDAAKPGSSTVGRAAFLEMINHFHDPDCPDRGVILWKLNRFSRDIDDAQFFKSDLRRRGYIIHSLHDSVPAGLDGRFFEAAVDWMSARYLEDLRADIKRGQRHLLDQYGALGGTPPRGFMRQPVQIGLRRDGRPHVAHRWVPDPAWIDRVRLAWAMRAEGSRYTEIHRATHLYASERTYATFFRNRLYIGELAIGETIIQNYCEPVIDRRLWEAVQIMMDANHHLYHNLQSGNPQHPRRVNSKFLLSGLVRCALCGTSMYGTVTSSKNRRYGYYDCGHRRDGGCTALKIPQAVLEDAVIDHLVNHILQTDNLTALLATYQQDADQQQRAMQTQVDALDRQLSQVRRQINNLADVLAEDGLQSRTLIKKIRGLEDEENGLVLQIQKACAPVQPAEPQTGQELDASLADIKQRLLAPEHSGDVKKILAGLIDHIDVRRAGKNELVGVIFYYLPPSGGGDFMSTVRRPRRGVIYTHKFSYTY